MTRRLLHLLVAVAMASAVVVASPRPAQAAPLEDVGFALPADPPAGAGGAVTSAEQVQPAAVRPAVARVNAVRAQFGAAPVVENATWSSAAVKHSTYMAENEVVTHTEDPALTHDSAAGNTSGMNSLVAAGWSTEAEFVDAWIASPFHLVSMLHTGLASMGYGQFTSSRTSGTAATLDVLQGRTKAQATSGWPRAWPRGTTRIVEMSDASSPDPAAGCPAPSGSWYGTASLVDFGPGRAVTSATATLREEGVPMPVCVRTASQYTEPTAQGLMAGKVLIIPLRPLQLDRGYSGTVTTNQGTATLAFDTGNPASGVFGDHTGDGLADILSVHAVDNTLSLHQTASGPSLRPAVEVGQNWGSMNWIATVPDLNGDRRTELLARRQDGTLWLYRGRGRGLWYAGVQVGHGWGGLSQITVLQDVTGDGVPEVVARTATGDLLRYAINRSTGALSLQARIGSGWHGMERLLSAGDFTGDGITDILAIGRTGLLYCYPMTRTGSIGLVRVVGQGWSGWRHAFSPGDMNRDGRLDLVGIRTDGVGFFYANNLGSWSVARQLGTGWTPVRLAT